jgi:hypothetical protein
MSAMLYLMVGKGTEKSKGMSGKIQVSLKRRIDFMHKMSLEAAFLPVSVKNDTMT